MTATTRRTKPLDLQARRIAKARAETPPDLAAELCALVRALKPSSYASSVTCARSTGSATDWAACRW